MKIIIKTLGALSLALALAGCGSDGPGGLFNLNDTNSGATPSLGLVQNANVNFYQADGTTLLGTGNTGNDGQVQVSVGSYQGPVVVEVVGDNANAMYFDEATGALVSFPSGSIMRALVPNASSTVGVTPLTELAYQAAIQQNLLPVSASAVNEINNIVRAALAPGLTSILSVPTRFDSNTGASSLADDEAGRYALVLAALANLNSASGSPALATLNALVADLVDGVVDGQANGSPVAGGGYGANFINEMTTALNNAAASFGTTALQNNAATQAPADTQVDTSGVNNGGGANTGGTPNGTTTPATINSALVGTFDLLYEEGVPGAPFTDGQMVQAIVGSDNSLQLPGVPRLTNPFFRSFGPPNTAEIIWLDTASNIEYALSNNAGGTFNEINVGDASNPQSTNGVPGFLGQLKMDQSNTGGGGAPPELAAVAGQYMGQLVAKSGTFAQGRTLGDMVLVNIDSNSVVTVDSSFVFDPSDASYNFTDNRGNPVESFYRVEVDTSTNGDSQRFDVIFENDNSNTPIAYRLRVTENLGGGSFRASTLELEERPLPAEVTSFFSAAIADSPVTLTGISVVQGFNTSFDVCEEVSLISDDGTSVNSSNSRTPFRYRLDDVNGNFKDAENYRRSNTRYSDNSGDLALEFARNRIVRRADGFIDFVSLNAQNIEGARATNDPAQINAACGMGGGGSANGALGSDDGASGQIDGATETVTDQVLVQEGSGLIGITASQSNPQRNWGLRFPASVGSHPCSPSPSTFIQFGKNFGESDQLNAQALGDGAGSCTIVVNSLTATTVKGTFSGTLIDNNDDEFVVTNGEFSADRP